jgi:methionyl aminopeptidase
MVFAIEPMICEGGYEVETLSNRWTVVTADGKLSAHYENTVVITDGEPELLTLAY